MQNKFLYQIICLSALFVTTLAHAQMPDAELDMTVEPEAPMAIEQATDNMPDLTNRQAVDFPARTSLDTMELAPLPGIYETDITGPVPLGASVSAKDMPSERLIGVLTPEVFKEMAELERDNTFLKLQTQKEMAKNQLETLRANYRQARLDEIARREEVVRTRIQWWQEQEKLRQDMEQQQAALESAKAEQAISIVSEPTEAQGNEKSESNKSTNKDDNEDEDEEDTPKEQEEKKYALVSITGTRGALNARIKNIQTGRLSNINVGDKLTDGSVVEAISATQVILNKNGEKVALIFDDV